MFVGHNFIIDKMLNKKSIRNKKNLEDNNKDEFELKGIK
jgi:hypothetical protein